MTVRDELMLHVPRLRRYARALLRQPDAADDLVQDVLEQALRKLTRFEPGTDLRAWLFTLMHNVFVSQMRRPPVRARHESLDASPWHESETRDAGAERAGPLDIRDLDAALQQLPAEQREVVLMVGLESLSYAEVALALDVPIGTVMSRLSRGRQRLRALMAGKPVERRLKVVR